MSDPEYPSAGVATASTSTSGETATSPRARQSSECAPQHGERHVHALLQSTQHRRLGVPTAGAGGGTRRGTRASPSTFMSSAGRVVATEAAMRAALAGPPSRADMTASSSSMNIVLGAWCLRGRRALRTSFSESPRHLSTMRLGARGAGKNAVPQLGDGFRQQRLSRGQSAAASGAPGFQKTVGKPRIFHGHHHSLLQQTFRLVQARDVAPTNAAAGPQVARYRRFVRARLRVSSRFLLKQVSATRRAASRSARKTETPTRRRRHRLRLRWDSNPRPRGPRCRRRTAPGRRASRARSVSPPENPRRRCRSSRPRDASPRPPRRRIFEAEGDPGERRTA